MPPSRRPEARRAGLVAAWLVLCAAGAASPASAQGWVSLAGIADVETWLTDDRSELLTKNDGHPAALGRVHVQGALRLYRGVSFIALSEFEGGNVEDEGGIAVSLDLFALRFTPTPQLTFHAGRFPSPVGTFAQRRFSPTNPLIGNPDGYPTTYPTGVMASGALGPLDYRAALVSLPVTDEEYFPEAAARLRPALGFGVTPVIGLRLGASYTAGPYLNPDLSSRLLAGAPWTAFRQRVGAVDARFSRGYFELFAELQASRYEVPQQTSPVRGTAYYVEAKYTWTPRLFTAVRLERNLYAIVEPQDSTWLASSTNLYDGEVGAGYRLGPATLIKASYRQDRWVVAPSLRSRFRSGRAFALQLSQQFDLVSLFDRREKGGRGP